MLGSVLASILELNMPPKSSPERFKNSIRNGMKKLSNFKVDFDRNLAPTWPSKKYFFGVLGNPMSASFGQLAPEPVFDRLLSTLDQFLIDLCAIFDQFLIDFE